MRKADDIVKINSNRLRSTVFTEFLIAILFATLLVNFIKIFPKDIVSGVTVLVSAIGIMPVVWRAFAALFEKRITIDLLASIAVIATFLHGDYVSAVFINLMLAFANLFDLITQRKTQDTISHLLKFRPAVVKIQSGDKVTDVPLENVKVGDLIVLQSGDRVPVDGTVVLGTASLNQATLTGESALVDKEVGSEVFSATLVEAGSLTVKAKKVGNDTTLAKMISLVDEASRAKTKTETIANRFSAWYIFGTLLLSLVVYLLTNNLTMVIGLLLVTCADDIAVAIPLGFTVAISKAARHGIIIKGAMVMEKLSEIKVFVTDKTGTLTKGITSVTGVVTFNGTDESKLLEAAGICAAGSKHPVAQAIKKHLKERKIAIIAPDEVHEKPGFGLSAKKNIHSYLQGKATYLIEEGVHMGVEEDKRIKEFQKKGESVTVFAIDGKLAGLISFEDQVRPHAKNVIIETKELGVRSWYMLTGDNEFVAERVGKLVGVDKYFSNLKPEDKLQKLKEFKKEPGMIAMVGDGVNDAPALALADVSFAMGVIGSDAAIETADIALMHDDLKRISEAMLLSKETLRIVKQNFAIWALSNIVGLSLVFTGVIGPVGASAYNFLTDFLPIMNVFQIWFLKINKHTYETA